MSVTKELHVNYSQSRLELLKWVKKKLIGEALEDDVLLESNPFDRYFTGILYPISELDEENEENEEEYSQEDGYEALAVKSSIGYQPPSSMGFSFYMEDGDHPLHISFEASRYVNPNKKGNIWSWEKQKLTANGGEGIVFINDNDVEQEKIIFDGLARINVIFRPHDKGLIATVTLTNNQIFDELNENDPRRSQAEKSLFEVGLECLIKKDVVFDYPAANKSLLSEEEKEIELRYKDERVYAIGHGIAVDWEFKEHDDLRIYSDFMPVVEVPQVTADTSDGSSKVLSFQFLADIDKNSDIVVELKSFVLEYDEWIEGQQKLAESEQNDDKNTASRIVNNMMIAKQRMMSGISLLERSPLAKTAFGIANKAMLAQMRGSFNEPNKADKYNYKWRPFQLAFILMLLESTVDENCEYRDVVDLIWFPTGGGKTEAYLGLMAFLFAYRRTRFKASSGGTVAIMRYTLRLLTSQQFIRACKVISALELIRQSNKFDLGEEPFTVGLWLGTAASPNTFRQAIEKVEDKQYSKLVLTSCPWCLEKFSEKNYICHQDSFHFTCKNNECDFGQNPNNKLPFNVVDEALYKQPPSLLIATVDKFARLAWEERASSFFGNNKNRPPELIIQDELHLISGALGSIVGLYEVGFESILLAQGVSAKYIASTATIKAAKEQIKALFARDMLVFPPAGLRHNDSFYAKTVSLKEKPGRMYIGYLPFGISKVKSLQPLAGALLAAPDRLFHNNDELMDAWWTQIIYHGSLKSVGNSRTNYQSGVLGYLHKLNELNFLNEINKEQPGLGNSIKNIKGLNIAEKYPNDIKGVSVLESIHNQFFPVRDLTIKSLTGNQSAQENADIFEALASPYEHDSSIDVVLATNMISVGLDVSRLALMIINGQPLTTAEYIQASSRVGRGKVPGLVFANYYKTQARSLSHYENFKSYHSTFYRYVEPSSVTPFTYQVRQRALHAALVTAMRHSGIGLLENKGAELFDRESPSVKRVIKTMKTRIIKASDDIEKVNKTLKHLDDLVQEWSSEVARCDEECINLRYNPMDKSAEALLISFEDGSKNIGLWKTLNSMRNVEKTGLFKIVREVNL